MHVKNVVGTVSQSYAVTSPPDGNINSAKHEKYMEKDPSVIGIADTTFSEKSTKNSRRKSSYCGSISHTIVTSLEQFFYR